MEKRTKEIIIELILFVIVLFLGVLLGLAGIEFYDSFKNKKQLDGLWLNNYNYSSAKRIAYNLDNSGEWVLVNVNKKDTFEETYKTCIHECSHSAYSELFAEKCENNQKLCDKLVKQYEK